jgi:subtilisin family serine protease
MNSNCSNNIIDEAYSDFIADYELASDEVLASSEICFIEIDKTYTAIYIPKYLVPEKSLDAYGYKVFVRLLGLMDEQSLEDSGVKKLRNISELNLRGQGVLIGIVDTGIDYTHKAFVNADGTSKIVSIWDQSIQSGNPPEGLYYGTEYTRDQINSALSSNDRGLIVPSTDDIGHGTFLAGIVAGNEDQENEFSGVVPDAELVVVKLKPAKNSVRDFFMVSHEAICYQENDVMLGVKYLLDTAEKYNRPISICIGLGTSQGSHDTSGALSGYLSAVAQMEGVAVSIAAGNEGNNRHHYERLMLPGTDMDTVDLNVGPNEKGLYFEIWGAVPNTFGLELTSPGGEVVPIIVPRIKERREVTFIFETTRINIYFQLVGSRSGAQLVIVRFQNPTEGNWRIMIHKMDKTLSLHINIWLPISSFIGNETFFINSVPYTTLTSPANVDNPIVVTAYDNSNDSLYLNASRGFTRTARIAPSLAAPGVNMKGPFFGNGYTLMTGTSVAAAHTTGIAAMLLEWGIVKANLDHMDGTDVKNMLLRGAQRESSRTYPSQEWGFGILNVYGVFENLRGNRP